jgi:hypothetical protein
MRFVVWVCFGLLLVVKVCHKLLWGFGCLKVVGCLLRFFSTSLFYAGFVLGCFFVSMFDLGFFRG